jgi:hypothetical protein
VLQQELEDGIGRVHLCVRACDPQENKGPPLPTQDDAADQAGSQRAAGEFDFGKAADGEGAFGFGEVSRVGARWGVREAEEAVGRDGKGDQGVDDEQPAPAGETGCTIKTLVDSTLHDAAEERTRESGRCEDGGTLANFFRLIPRSENPLYADEAAGLEDTLEEADDHDLPGVVHESGAESEEAPCHASGGQPDSRADFLHDQVVWDLAKEVASIKDRVDLVKLCAFEVEVFSGSRDVGIVQVGSVKVVDLVVDRQRGVRCVKRDVSILDLPST